MTIFFTADLHIGHRLMSVTRGFNGNIDEHDTAILSKLSDATKPDDIIYVLGDVAFCSYGRPGL